MVEYMFYILCNFNCPIMKSVGILGLCLALLSCQTQAQEKTNDMQVPSHVKTEQAVFGAGCFWCVEAVFLDLKGVYQVESGYMGGHVRNPSYRDVTTGATGHAEVARITFDP